ncbi:MAG: cysteine synthase A [Spirochaetes bacterium]|nr:cysteine synthase A [Spirochaetota bacterium]
MKIYTNILETVGNTPIVELTRFKGDIKPKILAKLEMFNPCGSLKDRIAISMLEDAEKKGKLKKNTKIIEPTSGNTGIALAMVCAVKGYKLVITMPGNMSIERIKIIEMLGAEVIPTDPLMGMTGAIDKANELVHEYDYFMPQQFKNPANSEIHRRTTAREIIRDTGGKISAFIAGIGTGGSITGVAEILKKEIGDTIKIVGVEPEESPVISGGQSGPHKIQGLGAGFIPDILNRAIIDQMIAVNYNDAVSMMKNLAKKEGILAGISSGAVLWATMQIAKEYNEEDTLLCLLGDTGERYLSSDII